MNKKLCLGKKIILLCAAAIIFAGCTTTPVHPSEPDASIESLLNGLVGLDAEVFMEEAYRQWVLLFPEIVTALGLAGSYGEGNTDLYGYDTDHVLLIQVFEVALLQQAHTYNPDLLSEGTRFNLQVFRWYFEQRVALHPYQWFDFPLWTESGSLSDQYVYLLMTQQPFRDEVDVEDYLGRLAAIGPQIDQLIGFLQTRQEHGISIPYLLYAKVMEEMGAHDWKVGWKTPFVTVLAVRLQSMENLPLEEKETYIERGGQIADEAILPAFERLMAALYDVAEGTTDAVGLSAQLQGMAAYQTLLDQTATLDIDADVLFDQAETRVMALGEAIHQAANDLGYDSSLPLQEIFRQARIDRDYALGLDIFVTLRSLMLDAEIAMDSSFDKLVNDDLVMVPVFEGGFYVPAALDGSRRAAFYAGFYGQEAHLSLPTQVYHETFPGHHYQSTLIQNSDLSLFRKAMHFPVFDEGWGLYAEYLAWDLGLFGEDPNANLGRLQSELIAAARVVVDIGIHLKGWYAQEAARYLVEFTGLDRTAANEMVLVQIAQPGQVVAGYVGYTFIRDLRDAAESELGNVFDLKIFHAAVLSGGSLPLPLLKEQVWRVLDL